MIFPHTMYRGHHTSPNPPQSSHSWSGPMPQTIHRTWDNHPYKFPLAGLPILYPLPIKGWLQYNLLNPEKYHSHTSSL